MSTDAFLTQILPSEEGDNTEAASSASSSRALVAPKEGVINLEIQGQIFVDKSDFQIITPYAGRQHHPFNIEYTLPVTVTAKELQALPIIVDADPETFKLGDRCGVQNLRINGTQFPTEMWEICRWRPEFLLSDNGTWLARNSTEHERIRDMYKAEIDGERKMVLKGEVMGEGRGLKIVTAKEDGVTDEQFLLLGNGGFTLGTMNHAFRSSSKRAAKHAFSLVLLDPSIVNIKTLTYDLVSSSLGMTVDVENGPNFSPTSKTAQFNLALHSLKPCLLAPSYIHHLHKCRPINIKATGTVRYNQTRSAEYAVMRSADNQVAKSHGVFTGIDAVLNKHTGFQVTGTLEGAHTHAITPMPASTVPNMDIGVQARPVVVYVVEDPDNAPTAPSLLMWRVEAKNFDGSYSRAISMLPSNLRIRSTLYGKDHVEANLDTDIVQFAEDENSDSVMMTAVIDKNTLLKTNVPRLYFFPSPIRNNKRVLDIVVSEGDDFEVFIMFSSTRFKEISMSNADDDTQVNVRNRNKLFMGAHSAHFEDSTIQNSIVYLSSPNKRVNFTVNATLSVRRK